MRAEQVVGGDGVDVRLAATMRFPGDVLAVIDCSLDAPLGHRLSVVGEGGELVLEDPFHAANPGILHDGQLDRGAVRESLRGPVRERRRRHPRRGRAAARTAATSVAQAAVIEALYRSAEAT